MRLLSSKSKNAVSYYVQKDIKRGSSRTTVIVEKLGTEQEIKEKYGVSDAKAWAKDYVADLNRKEMEEKAEILPINLKYYPDKLIDNAQRSYNAGYLFLNEIYHELKINQISKTIASKYKVTYDLDRILSRLLFTRILFPGSKLDSYEESKKFIEQPGFELHQIYRALEILDKESDYIQSELYKNSAKVFKRNTTLLYYDCTNFFFEIEDADEDGLRQYGKSKENRPNPIVQMGLFMDGNGIPLAFNMTRGNTNEQTTLRPLEKKILQEFELSKFIVCTDAGLSSNENKKYNDIQDRAYITTQSIKKLKAHLKAWALDPKGWKRQGSEEEFELSKIDESQHKDTIFYKERWIHENGLEEKLVVTYSLKYRDYQRHIREQQVTRAQKLIDSGVKIAMKPHPNDYRRFIGQINATNDGEIAEKTALKLASDKIQEEARYDGFYGVVTNLEAQAHEIAKINRERWQIEECFRIMKSEFKARPVYLSKDERIRAHFLTCFLALMIYRILEKKVGEKYTVHEILKTLREMNMLKTPQNDYLPAFMRTTITDDLFAAFGFRLDYEVTSEKKMKKILKDTKK